MNKFLRFALVAATTLNLVAGLAFAPRQQEDAHMRITQVDTTKFPKVTLYVSVTDADGNPFAVDPSRLIISENGQQIPLDQIEGVGDVGPLTTLLVMDVSDSMNSASKLDEAKAAAHKFVERMRSSDQTGIIAFNTQVQTVQAITSDKDALNGAIDSLSADKQTAMYDALISAIDQLEGQSGRRAIIVLTDGLDNSSSASENAVINHIGPAGFSISTVGLGVPAQVLDEKTGIDEKGLQDLASRAGGVYGYAEDEDSLTHLYETYAVSMQSEYAITYTSPATLRDGVNRSLSVALAPLNGGEAVANNNSRYNPGGLVPEVAQPAGWPLFTALVVGLAALVFVPMLLLANRQGATQAAGGRGRIKTKARPRIKLKD